MIKEIVEMTDHNPIEGTTALNMLLYMVPMPLFLSARGGAWVGVMRSHCAEMQDASFYLGLVGTGSIFGAKLATVRSC
jgi:hypothetical protein